MTATFPRIHRHAAAGLAAALLTVAAGCSTATDTALPALEASSSRSSTSSIASGRPVVMRFGDHAVAATLADNAASRELAGMLPLTLDLTDAWRQAKSGRLPHPVSVEGAARVRKPTPGGIYYWPDTAALAVFYDDLGQSVPPPGLIGLGVVDTGLDAIADAGRRVTVRIDRAAGTRTPQP